MVWTLTDPLLERPISGMRIGVIVSVGVPLFLLRLKGTKGPPIMGGPFYLRDRHAASRVLKSLSGLYLAVF